MRPMLDVAGVGIGPFNLSIAALLSGVPGVEARFFEARPHFRWHPGMMLPDARLQTSFLKDLVTGVAPRSRYTFLNYLVEHHRFYQFLNAELPAVSRAEYQDYLAWVARELDTLSFGSAVEAVTFQGDRFRLHFRDGREPVASRHLCLGTGARPSVPACARPHLGDACFHAIGIAERELDVAGKRVVVVGGGQSGAEVLLSLLDRHWGTPSAVTWLSRRPIFEPLDETPFTNEYFTPQYVDVFHGLPPEARESVVHGQKLASDGISPDTLRAIYRRIYEMKATRSVPFRLHLRPNRELVRMERGDGFRLTVLNRLDGTLGASGADVVILCTGFESAVPECLAPLRAELALDAEGRFVLGRSFEVRWNGPAESRIYAVNAGRHTHGIAEPQMSLMCWRSARIINHLAEREVFDLSQGMDVVEWVDGAAEEPVRTAPRLPFHRPGVIPEELPRLPRSA